MNNPNSSQRSCDEKNGEGASASSPALFQDQFSTSIRLDVHRVYGAEAHSPFQVGKWCCVAAELILFFSAASTMAVVDDFGNLVGVTA